MIAMQVHFCNVVWEHYNSYDANRYQQQFDYLHTEDLYRGCITTDGTEGWLDPTTLHQWYKQNTECDIVYADGRDIDLNDADAVVIGRGSEL